MEKIHTLHRRNKSWLITITPCDDTAGVPICTMPCLYFYCIPRVQSIVVSDVGVMCVNGCFHRWETMDLSDRHEKVGWGPLPIIISGKGGCQECRKKILMNAK